MNPRTPLRAARVRHLLPEHRFTRDLRVLGIVTSTSDLLLEEARKGAQDGLVLVADQQLAARGRRGTSWECPAGAGLLFSVLVRPLPHPQDRILISPAAGIAVARAIRQLELPAGLKWPNDILVQGTKVAGVLVDLEADFGVLGIGVNVCQHPGELPQDAPTPAASLELLLGSRVDRETLLAALLRELGAILPVVQEGDTEQVARSWQALDALPGHEVAVREGDRVLEGTVLSTHPREGISIRLRDGREVRLRAEHSRVLAVRFS